MSWDGTLGSVSHQDLFDSRYSDDQRIVVGNIPIDVREEEMEDLFSPFGKLLEVVFFAKALIGPKSKCNYAYLTLESAALVQQVLDSRPIYYPKDPTEPKRVKLSIKRKESKPTDGQSSSVKENDKSTESKNTEQKNGENSNSTESKDKKDGSTQTGKFTESKHGSKEAKEKDSGKNEKLPTEGGEFCGFEGMQHVCKELKISGREIYDKLASLSSRSTALEDQVCYVLGLLEKVKFKNQFPVGKNDEVADWLRKKGNKYYNNEGITDECSTKTALDYYSLSLCMCYYSPGTKTALDYYSLSLCMCYYSPGTKTALDYYSLSLCMANNFSLVIILQAQRPLWTTTLLACAWRTTHLFLFSRHKDRSGLLLS
uniref:RRM domain-containing protein n=1 Tax=Cacopsylla melanoneura TaxID=428564 RepID=A0A8D9FJ36_9HEMI